MLKQQVKIEELEKEAAEAALEAAKSQGSNKSLKGSPSARASPPEVVLPDSPEIKVQEGGISPEVMARHDQMQSKSSLISHPVLSHSKMSQGGITSKRHKKIEYTREYKIKLWEEMETTYFRDGLSAFTEIKKQNETVISNLNQCQRAFIQFLERPCKK